MEHIKRTAAKIMAQVKAIAPTKIFLEQNREVLLLKCVDRDTCGPLNPNFKAAIWFPEQIKCIQLYF
jgi:hypothetical protein